MENKSKSACVVLINKEGLVLGVSRKTDHNDFGLPGGKMEDIDNGDTMITAIRETKEETGLDVSNLELIFTKPSSDGNICYTYLAEYDGEINHNEPHVVKWIPFQLLINGSFGKYNNQVSESLSNLNIDFQLNIDEDAMAKEVAAYFLVQYDGEILFSYFEKDSRYSGYVAYDIHVKYPEDSIFDDEELEDGFDVSKKVAKDLANIGLKYGVNLGMSIYYSSK